MKKYQHSSQCSFSFSYDKYLGMYVCIQWIYAYLKPASQEDHKPESMQAMALSSYLKYAFIPFPRLFLIVIIIL